MGLNLGYLELCGNAGKCNAQVNWEPREDQIRFHFTSFELFDLQQRVSGIDKLLKCVLLVSRRQARRRRMILLLLAYRLRKSICKDLFLKRNEVLYPVPRLYPGGVFDPFWEDNGALFFFRFWFRRLHFQRIVYAMELSDKSFKCGNEKRFHWYPADLCIMVLSPQSSLTSQHNGQRKAICSLEMIYSCLNESRLPSWWGSSQKDVLKSCCSVQKSHLFWNAFIRILRAALSSSMLRHFLTPAAI